MKSLFLILLSYTTIVSTLINPIHHTASSFSSTSTKTTIISPPASASDYRQLASLLVSSFDAPQSYKQDDAVSKIQRLPWDLYEKSLTEEFTYKRYVKTVRRMRGKKYCLLLAKKNVVDDDDVSSESSDEVVGMVEMGMSLCPIPTNTTSNAAAADNDNGTYNNSQETMTPTPLIGVICVSPTHQKEGIATKLLQKCEEVAREIWNEEYICVDVEPDNAPALSLFEMGGYVECLDGEGGGALIRDTTILRRRSAEVRPHYLLRKRIRDDKGDDLKDDI